MTEWPKPSANPEHNRPIREDQEALRARLFMWHQARGTLGLFYELYPDQRPIEQEPAREPDKTQEQPRLLLRPDGGTKARERDRGRGRGRGG
jgi:hypothetical protein